METLPYEDVELTDCEITAVIKCHFCGKTATITNPETLLIAAIVDGLNDEDWRAMPEYWKPNGEYVARRIICRNCL